MSTNKSHKTSRIDPKTQKIIDIVVTSVEALVIVFCVVVSVLAWIGVGTDSLPVSWMAIRTNSMEGTGEDNFAPGDLIVSKRITSLAQLKELQQAAKDAGKEGVVITYKKSFIQNGQTAYDKVTHRLLSISDSDPDNVTLITHGDNTNAGALETVRFEDVLGYFDGKAEGLGKVILWLQGYTKEKVGEATVYNPPAEGKTPVTFLIILIPLILLFVYNGYVVVKWLMDERAKKIKESALAEAQQAMGDEEEIRRKAVADFMRMQGATDEDIEAFFAAQKAVAEVGSKYSDAAQDAVSQVDDGSADANAQDESNSASDPIASDAE